MTMESRDIEDYLQSMLDLSNPEHRRFVEMLLGRLGHSHAADGNKNKDSGATKKQNLIQLVQPAADSTGNKAPQQQSSKKKVKQINLFSKEGQARENITLPGQHRYIPCNPHF